jgi:hypothetical protein
LRVGLAGHGAQLSRMIRRFIAIGCRVYCVGLGRLRNLPRLIAVATVKANQGSSLLDDMLQSNEADGVATFTSGLCRQAAGL